MAVESITVVGGQVQVDDMQIGFLFVVERIRALIFGCLLGCPRSGAFARMRDGLLPVDENDICGVTNFIVVLFEAFYWRDDYSY